MKNNRSVVQIEDPREDKARFLCDYYDRLNHAREASLNKGMDARRYVTSSSTETTEVGTLPWKNKTTIPKLTQIVDLLKSYYMAALFPSDDWLVFEGIDDEAQRKASVIEIYFREKFKQPMFRQAIERILLDWLIYPGCFAGVEWVHDKVKDINTGKEITKYYGPRVYRVSPIDSLIDPQAPSFDRSIYYRRALEPIADILEREDISDDLKESIKNLRSGTENSYLDFYKQEGLRIDGFVDLESYLVSGYIEVLEFWGDIYFPSTGEYVKNKVITIVDRSFILDEKDNPTLSGRKPYAFSSWRRLPDNLWGQSSIDNLIGMQYRCDHLENLKADAFDQIIHPLMKIKGDTVEDFEFGPGAKIYCGSDGDVDFLRPDGTILQANNEIALYHKLMEEMVGAPKEAMGFRTPGEKTAFEVNMLSQGADRFFTDNLMHFEEDIIEPILNIAFELWAQNFSLEDIATTFKNNEEIITVLQSITKEDILANGTLKPMGSKHYIARNKRVQELQNFLQLAQTPSISPHVSGYRFGKMFEEELGFEKYNLVEQNIGVKESVITQQVAQQLQQMMGQQPNEPEPGVS